MARIPTLCLAGVLLSPLAARADKIDVPELGLRFTTLPSAASTPEVTAQPSTDTMTTQLGPAVLTIYREHALAPSGSDVAEPKYRAALDARFDYRFDSKAQGAPTDIGGHSGWTVVSVRPTDSAGPTQYTCLTYVLVEQHLYRLLVSASGTPNRPPEFDSLVMALSGIQFEPPVKVASPAAQP
jgi:hypothetical protein